MPSRPQTPAVGFCVQDLSAGVGHAPAVRGVSFALAPGAALAVVGPNGAGKTTLLRTLAGELAPRAGALSRPVGAIGWLPQIPRVERSFPITVRGLVAMGLSRAGKLSAGVREARIAASLEAMRLTPLAAQPIGAVSEGELRRALFARLMLEDASAIVLDEPFAGVDAAGAQAMLTVIGEWARAGRTVIAAAHDLDLVRTHFPLTLILARQLIAFGPTAETLRPEPLARAHAALAHPMAAAA